MKQYLDIRISFVQPSSILIDGGLETQRESINVWMRSVALSAESIGRGIQGATENCSRCRKIRK